MSPANLSSVITYFDRISLSNMLIRVFREAETKKGLDVQEIYWGKCIWGMKAESRSRWREPSDYNASLKAAKKRRIRLMGSFWIKVSIRILALGRNGSAVILCRAQFSSHIMPNSPRKAWPDMNSMVGPFRNCQSTLFPTTSSLEGQSDQSTSMVTSDSNATKSQ